MVDLVYVVYSNMKFTVVEEFARAYCAVAGILKQLGDRWRALILHWLTVPPIPVREEDGRAWMKGRSVYTSYD